MFIHVNYHIMEQEGLTNALNGIRVGLVDDHCLFREGIKSILRETPEFEVCMEAENGKDLIKKWEQLPRNKYPDVMLVDINMPEMDGFQTVEWLRKNYPNIKIAVLTMFNNSSEKAVRMVKLGVDAYLTKDTDPEEIKNSLRLIMQNKTSFPSEIANLLIESIRDSNLEEKQGKEFRIKKTFQTLPTKESQVARYFCSELTYSEIAEKLAYSTRAIETFRVNLFQKFQVTTRVGLAVLLIKYNLVEI